MCVVVVNDTVTDDVDNDRNCNLREGAAKELSNTLRAKSHMEELYLRFVALPPFFSLSVSLFISH